MNKKYRLFGKIPVVDILILLALAAVLIAALKFITREEVQVETGTEAQTAQTYPYTATFLVENVGESTAELFAEGDELYLASGYHAGTVTDVEIKDYVKYGFDSEGKSVATEVEGRKDVYVTVDGIATSKNKKVMSVKNKMISYGKTIALGNDKYYCDMITVDIVREAE